MTKQQLRETIRRIINQELNEAPYPAIAPDETETEEDTELFPDEEDDDLTIGNPNVKPEPKAEEDILKKIIARYKTSLNEKKYK